MNKTWITDRPPTAADANRFGRVLMLCVDGDAITALWGDLEVGTPWLPLNDLPKCCAPVQKEKTQAQIDGERADWHCKNVLDCGRKQDFLAGVYYAREDLKRQVREIIEEDDMRCENRLKGISSFGGQQLRELVKEDK